MNLVSLAVMPVQTCSLSMLWSMLKQAETCLVQLEEVLVEACGHGHGP